APRPRPGQQRAYLRAPHSASTLALAVAELARGHDGLVLAVARDSHAAQSLEHDLRVFAGPGLPVLHFADWETLPYDLFSPHPGPGGGRAGPRPRRPGPGRGPRQPRGTVARARPAGVRRPRPAGAAFRRLGNPALRPVQSAPGHRFPAHLRPVAAADAEARRA